MPSNGKAIGFFNVGWDQLASSAGPPSLSVNTTCYSAMVGRCGETPLVPPCILLSFKKRLPLPAIGSFQFS